ncbi:MULTISPECIES: hypothetical protein [Bacillus subtilis group]|uniref:hypothetical protein n=1 Tax=Bacillus subtilis group TaxID=653685 RepID=UPI0009B7B8C3|nr:MULTISPECIES: hypothetical protein [Bacillus subtilis group]ARC67412.1 hypothetical protein B14_200201 [Bacillus licheniformis]ARW46179.1 hypothetical protein S100141_04961 [Bacillus licheniformis]MDE1421842.1 hypothetical protein [Bacillus licheniformis]MEC0475847.1 hypothetical protein [Bacillus licheniformis]MED4337976.1 hypothetical protein [Bacillus licheniformis]
MATNTTKIALYDLDPQAAILLEDLIRVRGSYASLYERLTSINTELFDADTKKAVEDLIDGYNKTSKLTNERIEEIELMMKVSVSETMNGVEELVYDPDYQQVTRHIVKSPAGSILYTIDYVYKDIENGILDYSEKRFSNTDSEIISVKKVFSYDENENIIKIETKTTIGEPKG